MKFSILMNCYNCEKYLVEAMNSIYSQTFEDWEIIFIDNSSIDNSKEIALNYDSRVKYHQTPYFMSLGEARNFGLQFCKGEYLAFLDTDDVWYSFKLKEQIEILDSDKSLAMCYSSVMFIDENSKELAKLVAVAKSGDVFKQQLLRYEINMQSVAIRNNIPISFNPKMEFSPDFDLFMKIVSKYQVAVVSEPLVKYRLVSSSLTNKKIARWWIEMKMTLDAIFEENPEFLKKYSDEVKIAYAKVSYYKARYLMKIGENRKAKEELKKNRSLNLSYFALYILSLFPPIWNRIFKS
jgi:glycosyltransferase involved in cell wall biosynthesis